MIVWDGTSESGNSGVRTLENPKTYGGFDSLSEEADQRISIAAQPEMAPAKGTRVRVATLES